MLGKLSRANDPAAAAHDAWTALRHDLDALAAAPGDHAAWAAVGRRWYELALLPAADAKPGKTLPPGFTLRPSGTVQDCLVTARAVEQLTWMIGAGVAPVHMLALRADLRLGWRQYDDALADLERAEAALDPADPESLRIRHALHARAAEIRAAADAETEPSPAVQGDLRKKIEIAAHSAARLLSLGPSRDDHYSPGSAFEPSVDARLRAFGQQLAAAGFRHITWTDHREIQQRSGNRVISGTWGSPDGCVIVSSGIIKDRRTTSLLTQLSDGRILETNLSRGRTHFRRGPWVDLLNVDPTESFADLTALHMTRVRVAMAMSPGVWWVPIDSLDAVVRMRDLERGYACEFRLEHGLDEAEARGLPFAYPRFTVPLLQQAAWETVRTAYNAAVQSAAA